MSRRIDNVCDSNVRKTKDRILKSARFKNIKKNHQLKSDKYSTK